MSEIENIKGGINQAIDEAGKAPAMDVHTGWTGVYAGLSEASDKLAEGLAALSRADGGLSAVQDASQKTAGYADAANGMINGLAAGSQDERAAAAMASAAGFKEVADKRVQMGATIATLLEALRPAADTLRQNLDSLDNITELIAMDDEDVTAPQAQSKMIEDATTWRDGL